MGKDGFAFFKNEFSKSDKVKMLSDDELKKLQQIQLQMLRDFVEVSNKYNINYCLSGGTALGAIRHGGFIPWDDDIDLNMSRKDFELLKSKLMDHYSDIYTICAPEMTKGHGMSVAQIKKKGTVYQSFNEIGKPDSGICIDIFVLENTPNNAFLRKLHGFMCLGFGYMLTCKKTCVDYKYMKEYVDDNKVLQKALRKKVIFGKMLFFLSLDRVAKMTKKVYSMCKNNQSKYVTIPSGRKHYFGEMALRSEMCEVTPIQFEDVEAKLAKGNANYMHRLYGNNYMTVPPVEKREKHPIMKIEFGDNN